MIMLFGGVLALLVLASTVGFILSRRARTPESIATVET